MIEKILDERLKSIPLHDARLIFLRTAGVSLSSYDMMRPKYLNCVTRLRGSPYAVKVWRRAVLPCAAVACWRVALWHAHARHRHPVCFVAVGKVPAQIVVLASMINAHLASLYFHARQIINIIHLLLLILSAPL